MTLEKDFTFINWRLEWPENSSTVAIDSLVVL